MGKDREEREETEVIFQVENVRITRRDKHNLALERLETHYHNVYKREITNYNFKGYYSTKIAALKAIIDKELLVGEKEIKDLKSYVKRVEESNEKVYKEIEKLQGNIK